LKRKLLLILVIISIVLFSGIQVAAAPGGAPGKHGANGRDFGGLISDTAQIAPLVLAYHAATGTFPT
jgi:hypothetical protein